MGRGPGAFLQSGMIDHLRRAGHDVNLESVELNGSFPTELAAAFEVSRILSGHVREAISNHRFPLILSGNSNSSVGTLAGLGDHKTGIIWFDGHGDFNTPETSTSGVLDGMALAMLTGRCFRDLSSTIPDFQPIPEQHVILVGARDFDPEEKRLLDSSGIALVSRSFIRNMNIIEALKPAVNDLQNRVNKVHIHLDLDVLDPQTTPANRYSPPDGLSVGAVEVGIRLIESRFSISSACISAYDPECDPEQATIEAGIKLIETILRRTRSANS